MKKYWYLLLPFSLMAAVAYLLPLMWFLFHSFTSFLPRQEVVFKGIQNYADTLRSDVFLISIMNYLLFSFISIIIGVFFSYVIWRGSFMWRKPARIFTGVILSGISIYSFIPVLMPHFFRSDSYGIINGILINLGAVSGPVDFTGDPYIARLIYIFLITISLIGPSYLIFSLTAKHNEVKFILSAIAGIVISNAATFFTIPVFGMPSMEYVVHNPLLYMYEQGFIRMNPGKMYAVMMLAIILSLFAALIPGLIGFAAGKINLKDRNMLFTRIISAVVVIKSLGILLFLMLITFLRTFMPLQEMLMFPAPVFPGQPTLDHYRSFIVSGIWTDVLKAFSVQTFVAVWLFCILALPLAYAISKSKRPVRFILPASLLFIILSIMPMGFLVIESYILLAVLTLLVSPFFIASVFICSNAIKKNRPLTAVFSGIIISLFGSYVNAGIISGRENFGLANLYMASFRDYITPYIVFSIVFLTGITAAFLTGISGEDKPV